LEAASAANAPSLATVRIRMIVDRSTCSVAAASAIVLLTNQPKPDLVLL
jgi:hypothetical protein